MQHTTNYNLNKPDQEDAYDIQNENDNMDILDDALNEKMNITSAKTIELVDELPDEPVGTTLYLVP